MLLLYFYCILGFTNLHIINKYKKKENSIILIQNYSYNILYNIYSLFIIILLIFSFVYDIIYNKNINFGYNLYKLNYISQFIILYFKFHKIIQYNFYENIYFYNINLYSQFIISIILIFNIYNYNNLINHYNYITFIINIIDIIGLYIYYNSLLLFILIFIKLCQNIYLIRKELIEYILQEKKGIIELYYNIIKLKYKSSNYITDFNYIFNIFTIINILSLIFIYEEINIININNHIYDIFIIFIFIFLEIFILCIILYISKIRTDIYNEMFSSIIFEKFIKKYNILTFNDKYNIQLDINNNVSYANIICSLNENTKSLDWLILYNTLNIKWMNISLFGIEIQSFSSISQIIFCSSILYKLYY